MNESTNNGFLNDSERSEAEQTLRLIARVSAPAGLEDRVHAKLLAAPRPARVLRWPVASQSGAWQRGIAAAAVVLIVAGGSWGVYSRVAPGQPAKGLSGPRIAGPGEFSQGGAVRRPQTLQGPVVTPKQSATHPLATPKLKGKSSAPKIGKDTNAPLVK